MPKHGAKEIFFVSLFFLLVFVMGRLLWDEIGENSDNILDKLEKNKSTKMISPANVTVPTASIPSEGQSLPMPEKKIENLAEADSSGIDANLDNEPASDKKEEDAAAEENIADWRQYADKEKQFKFHYPESVSVEASGDSVKVIGMDEEWKIKKYSNKDENELDAWYQNYFSEKERKDCLLVGGELKAGEHETRRAKASSGDKECDKAGYFFFGDSKKVVVRIESEKEATEQMKKILKTFEFED